MKTVKRMSCRRCGGALLKERDLDDNSLILRCLLCGQPHTANGEPIIPKVLIGRINNKKLK